MLILLADELQDRNCLFRILRSKARLQALLDPTAEAMDASAAILILRYRLHISLGEEEEEEDDDTVCGGDGDDDVCMFILFRARRNPRVNLDFKLELFGLKDKSRGFMVVDRG